MFLLGGLAIFVFGFLKTDVWETEEFISFSSLS